MNGMGMVRPGASVSTDVVERIDLRKRRSWLQEAVAGFKAMSSMLFPRNPSWSFGDRSYLSQGGTISYAERVGDGRNNSIVFAALELLATTFSQSPPVVKQIAGDQLNIVANHELVKRLSNPNPFYSGKLLWKATMIDYAFGNAYWLKVRSAAGKAVEYYWVPSTMIEPVWPNDNARVFISHYRYMPNGVEEKVPVENVVHFRNGMDPKNIRKGLSPLGAMIREIATDDEAAEMINTVLHNLGVTGMVLSPSSEKGKINDADAQKLKAQIMARSTGDRRGDPLVVSHSVKVDQMAHDFGKFDVGGLRHIPEERITAIFSTPAVLLGLGTGLENATYSNVDGLRRIFYENKVIPIQTFIGDDLHTQVLREYVEDVSQYVVEFDNTGVRVLQEDEDKLVDRITKELESGTLTANEARALRNRDPYPEDMFLLSSRIIPVLVDDIAKKAEVQDEPVVEGGQANGDNGSGSGNGNSGSTGGGGTPQSGSGSGKGRADDVSTKDIGDSIDRIRAYLSDSCAADVQKYLVNQRDMVVTQVLEQEKSKIRINWPRVQEDYETLKAALEPWYKRALVAVHDVVQDVLDTRYELTGTDERTYLKNAALNIKGINETTRRSVADAIATSVAADETTEQLVARIMALDVFQPTRATLIGRTELAQATNLAQVESYRASEVVVGVRITDGDADKICAALNGKKVKITEARSIPALGHPNCVRRFNHILDVSELEDSEAA